MKAKDETEMDEEELRSLHEFLEEEVDKGVANAKDVKIGREPTEEELNRQLNRAPASPTRFGLFVYRNYITCTYKTALQSTCIRYEKDGDGCIITDNVNPKPEFIETHSYIRAAAHQLMQVVKETMNIDKLVLEKEKAVSHLHMLAVSYHVFKPIGKHCIAINKKMASKKIVFYVQSSFLVGCWIITMMNPIKKHLVLKTWRDRHGVLRKKKKIMT